MPIPLQSGKPRLPPSLSGPFWKRNIPAKDPSRRRTMYSTSQQTSAPVPAQPNMRPRRSSITVLSRPSGLRANPRPTTNAPLFENVSGDRTEPRRPSPVARSTAVRPPRQPHRMRPRCHRQMNCQLNLGGTGRFRVAQRRMCRDNHARHKQPSAGRHDSARRVPLQSKDSSLPFPRVFSESAHNCSPTYLSEGLLASSSE